MMTILHAAFDRHDRATPQALDQGSLVLNDLDRHVGIETIEVEFQRPSLVDFESDRDGQLGDLEFGLRPVGSGAVETVAMHACADDGR